MPDAPVDVTIRVSGNPMLFYIGTDQKVYRVDNGEIPTDTRECAIFDTLHRLATIAKTSTGRLVP